MATERGRIVALAKVMPTVPAGCLFMPFHFREGPANMLTNDALDPAAGIPELKVCAAKLTPA